MQNQIGDTYQLEPQQYERLYYEEDIPLKDISKGLGPRLFGTSLVLLMAAIIVAATVTYPDQVELPFVLRGDQREQVYAFPFPVYIKEIYVRPGDPVTEGQPLLRLTSPEIATMITDLEGRQARKETFDEITGSSYLRQMEILDRQGMQWLARARQLKGDIDLLDQQWASRVSVLDVMRKEAQDHAEAAKKLFGEGIISRMELQEKERAYTQAIDARAQGEVQYKRERMALLAALEAANQSATAANLEKSKLEYDKSARSGDLGSEASTAGDLIESIFGSYRIEDGAVVLLSRQEQTVSFVFEGDAEIPSGVTVIKLTQATRADYAFLKCPPHAAGRIQEQMHVKLKVSSFPHYEWGVAEGMVMSRSQSPDENGDYNIRVSLTDAGRLKELLFPGLDGKAVIILQEKTLFQYFFRTLSKTYHRLVEGEAMPAR